MRAHGVGAQRVRRKVWGAKYEGAKGWGAKWGGGGGVKYWGRMVWGRKVLRRKVWGRKVWCAKYGGAKCRGTKFRGRKVWRRKVWGGGGAQSGYNRFDFSTCLTRSKSHRHRPTLKLERLAPTEFAFRFSRRNPFLGK